jgi:hypothetical protein
MIVAAGPASERTLALSLTVALQFFRVPGFVRALIKSERALTLERGLFHILGKKPA